jgi:tRNA threonylcarbamoyladenosine biosynthesis protein TsaB
VKILAIDTATENCSAALLSDGALTTYEELLHKGAAERILPMVQELLTASGTSLASLDAIAFGRGPGGFTGVRLAASITQGLAYAAGIKVAAISDLRAVAQRALGTAGAGSSVLVCADARMREVYWACFTRDAAGDAQPVGEERVGTPESVELPRKWQTPAEVLGAGSGFAAYPQLHTRLAPHLRAIEAGLLPRASEIAQLAVAEVRAGRLVEAHEAIPVYLRDNVARAAASH